MAWRKMCAVFLIVPWELGILNAIIMDNINSTDNYCPRNCSCPLLYRADCRNRGLKLINADIFPENGNRLRGLWLDGNDISSLDTNAFKKLTKLKYLSLYQNSLKCITKNIFVNLKKLVILDLSNNKLQYLDSDLFKSFKRLKKLNLSFNNLKVINGNLLSPLETIEDLNLSNNPFDCTNCILRGAADWAKSKMMDTRATCMTPKSGIRWKDYEFFNCILTSGSLDPLGCDKPESEDSETQITDPLEFTFSLPTILAIVFGIALLIVILGLIIYCCRQKTSNRSSTENEMHEYDDIKPSEDYYYERVGRTGLNNLRYVASRSFTSVPELPRRPKKEEAKNVSKDYDDVYFKDELTSTASYIEPELPQLEGKTPKQISSCNITYNNDSHVHPSASKIRTDTEGNEQKSSENEVLTPGTGTSKLGNDNITIKENDDVRCSSTQSSDKNKSADFFWDRQSFWKI